MRVRLPPTLPNLRWACNPRRLRTDDVVIGIAIVGSNPTMPTKFSSLHYSNL